MGMWGEKPYLKRTLVDLHLMSLMNNAMMPASRKERKIVRNAVGNGLQKLWQDAAGGQVWPSIQQIHVVT